MLTPSTYNILENVIYISSKIVLLQTLRAGYLMELEQEIKQEIKNFRTAVLIDTIQNILQELEPYMDFLMACEEGKIFVNANQRPYIRDMIRDLTDFYKWATEEIKLKNKRMALMELESKWPVE